MMRNGCFDKELHWSNRLLDFVGILKRPFLKRPSSYLKPVYLGTRCAQLSREALVRFQVENVSEGGVVTRRQWPRRVT